MNTTWLLKKTPLEIVGQHPLCQAPDHVQAYLESTLNMYHKYETLRQYVTNNQRRFAWLCVYFMVMIFALATSLAYRYYSGLGNLLWIYSIINAAAIILAYANSMGSMNADACLIIKAGVCLGIAGILAGFSLSKCLALCIVVYRSYYFTLHHRTTHSNWCCRLNYCWAKVCSTRLWLLWKSACAASHQQYNSYCTVKTSLHTLPVWLAVQS